MPNTEQWRIPKEYPAHGQDWFNYSAHNGISNCQIQAVLDFDRMLDYDRLKRAVRLSVDAEPILGCRFVEDEHHPYWQRLADLDAFEWCSQEKVTDREQAVLSYLEQPLDLEQGPQVQTRLVRCGGRDTLCVKLNHASCDGGGAKEFLALLATIYTGIGNRGFDLRPNVRDKRDQGGLFMELGILDPKTAWDPQLAELKPTWGFPRRQGGSDGFRVAICRISPDRFDSLSVYAKERNATINDLLLTAYFRAMFEIVQPEAGAPMEILVTMDLRRYLPGGKAGAICNLSGALNTRIAWQPGESFESTLGRMVVNMKDLKRNRPGVHAAVMFEFLSDLGYGKAVELLDNEWREGVQTGKCSPMLSNFGIISTSAIKFGEAVVRDAYMVSPAFNAPAFMLGAGTYNKRLTLTVGYQEATVGTEDVERFFTLLLNDLSVLSRS